jgi:fatty-acyl-CoA synthase
VAVNPYSVGLEQNPANFVALSPLSFLERSAFVYPKRISIIQDDRKYTWKESYDRCRQLASALKNRGIGKGDTVAVMLPNSAPMFECHFGVPMTGAVLNTLNTRLDAEAIAFMLTHGEAKVLITDPEFLKTIKAALELIDGPKPLVIDIVDAEYPACRSVLVKRITKHFSTKVSLTSPGSCRKTSGMPSPSTTPRAPPAIQRVSFITIAALT